MGDKAHCMRAPALIKAIARCGSAHHVAHGTALMSHMSWQGADRVRQLRPATVLSFVARTGLVAALQRLHPQAAAIAEAAVVVTSLPPALWRRRVCAMHPWSSCSHAACCCAGRVHVLSMQDTAAQPCWQAQRLCLEMLCTCMHAIFATALN